MKAPKFESFPWGLLIGDLLAIGVVTVFGFATHGELGSTGLRILTTYVPLVAAWLLVAPHLGVYSREVAVDLRQIWRPGWAMLLGAPLAAWLRGLWLNAPIIPIFVAVLGGVGAVGILAWRLVYAWVVTRKKLSYG